MPADNTSLPTNVDSTYPDNAADASVELHQHHHDVIHAFTNGHSTNTDPHGDRAYTDAQIAGAAISGLTQAQVLALIAKLPIHAVTANYTLALTDAGQLVSVNSATAVAVTIPTAASVNFLDTTTIVVGWYGAGSVAIVPAAGVTLLGLPSISTAHLLAAQFAKVVLHKVTGDTWWATGEFALSSSAVMPTPTGTPTVGQVPVVTTVTPLALGWGAGSGGGGGALYVGQLRGLTAGSGAQSTSISPGGTAIPLSLAGRVVGLDVLTHANAVTIPTGLNGDYLVIAKAKVSTTAGGVSLANLTNGITPTAGGGVTGTGGRARFTVGNTGGYSPNDYVGRTFGSGPLNVADVDMTMDIYMSGESYPILTARANSNTLNGTTMYQCAVNQAGTNLQILKLVGGTPTALGTYAFQLPVNTLGRVRFSVVGTTLKAWIETGTAALTGAANITVTDSSISAAGFCGLNVGGGGAANSGSYAEIDNLTVTNGAGTPTNLVVDTFDGGAPQVDQKALSITVNGAVVETVTGNAASPRLENVAYLTLNVGDYVGLQGSGATAYTVEALVANDVSLTLVKQ